jgi:hypothetical protein
VVCREIPLIAAIGLAALTETGLPLLWRFYPRSHNFFLNLLPHDNTAVPRPFFTYAQLLAYFAEKFA